MDSCLRRNDNKEIRSSGPQRPPYIGSPQRGSPTFLFKICLLRAEDKQSMLNDFLEKKKRAILERWLHLILETYPADTGTMMRKDKNQFTNPVGSTISREIEVLLGKLCEGIQDEKCQTSLDSILKIRSVQDFSPSKAVGFVFLLKRAIGETLKNEICKESVMDEWLKFQSRIDELALLAFDIYMDCREKICEIRVKEARAEREMALKMMERMYGLKEKPEKGGSGNS